MRERDEMLLYDKWYSLDYFQFSWYQVIFFLDILLLLLLLLRYISKIVCLLIFYDLSVHLFVSVLLVLS